MKNGRVFYERNGFIFRLLNKRDKRLFDVILINLPKFSGGQRAVESGILYTGSIRQCKKWCNYFVKLPTESKGSIIAKAGLTFREKDHEALFVQYTRIYKVIRGKQVLHDSFPNQSDIAPTLKALKALGLEAFTDGSVSRTFTVKKSESNEYKESTLHEAREAQGAINEKPYMRKKQAQRPTGKQSTWKRASMKK